MKNYLILLILVFALSYPVNGQVDLQQKYERKVESFTKMRTGGWVMTGVGSGFILTGGVLITTIPDSFWNDDYYYEDKDDGLDEGLRFMGGIISIGVGVGLIAGGITMSSISSKKIKQYRTKLDNLSINPIISPKVQGFSLTYRF